MSDGGLVLALPLFVAIAGTLLVGARALPSALRSGDLVQAGSWVSFLVLLLHSGMDFDWTYPSLLSLTALVGVLALPRDRVSSDSSRDRSSRGRRALAVLAVVLLVAAGVGAWDGGLDLNTAIPAAG